MMDTENRADRKAAQAHYEWYGYDRVPLHPQPGIFETTEGHEEILRLLAQPRFDWRLVLVRSDDQWATRTGRGWAPVEGVYHLFGPRPEGPRKMFSVCGERRIMAGRPLRYTAAGEDRCGDCLHLEIMKAML